MNARLNRQTRQTGQPKRLCVLLSGRGSNLQSIVRACDNGTLTAQVARVISNRPDAAGLDFARENRIDARIVDHSKYADRDHFERQLIAEIEIANPQLIILAGFMRRLTTTFVNRFKGLVLNIHPSLLPRYPGLDTHNQVLVAGDKQHGCSVHFVTQELDGGPVIAQSSVPVMDSDSESTLACRVLQKEHKLYPYVIDLCLSGQVKFQDGHVLFNGKRQQQPILY